MGFLGNLFNAVAESLAPVAEQSGEELRKVISQLKSDTRINGNTAIKKVLEEYQKYSKIGFGIESAVDKENLLKTFQIKSGEIVIAIVRGKGATFSMSKVDRVVLTDKALYTHPSIVEDVQNKKAQLIHCDNTTNRFPIDEFCKYILYAPGKYNVIMFQNESGVFILDKKSVFKAVLSKNQDEISLYNIIRDIQQCLCKSSEVANVDRENVLQWLDSKAENQLFQGCMDEDTLLLVERLKTEDNEWRWGKILWKNALHLYDVKLLEKRTKEISEYAEGDKKDCILKEFEEMCNEFLGYLKQSNHYFNAEFWKKNQISRNFFKESFEKNNVESSSFESRIWNIFEQKKYSLGIYMAIRKYPETELKVVENYLEQLGESEQKENILKLVLFFRNQRMRKVFEAVRDNEKMEEEWCGWTDGFGLTALHYAIMLNNRIKVEEIAMIMADKKVKKNLPKELEDIYDYGVLCAFLGRTEYVNDIVVFSKETQPLINSRKKMQFLLKVKQTSYNAHKKGIQNIEASYRRARNSGNYSQEQLERLENEIYEAKEHLYAFHEEIEALEADIEEIENEIYAMGKILFTKYSELADCIRNAESICEKMLKWLYSSPDVLYRTLNLNESECELHYIDGIFFSIPKDIFAERNNRTSSRTKKEERYQERKREEQKEKKATSQQKPYGAHWFSPTAYTDIKVLRKEYRKLATKYHPDNNSDGVEVFLEIQKERETILESLKE